MSEQFAREFARRTRVGVVAALWCLHSGCSSNAATDPPAGGTGGGGSGFARGGEPAAGQGSGGVSGVAGAAAGSNAGGGAGLPQQGGSGSGGTGGAGGSSNLGGSSAAGTSAGGGAGGAKANGSCAPTLKFCEGFEDGQPGALPKGWMPIKGYEALSPNDVGLSSEQAHSGKMSLKSSSVKRGATRAQLDLASLGATAHQHWGRIFYRVDEPSPKPGGYFHTTFVALVGPAGENRIVDSVEAPNGTHQWLFNVPSDSCCTSSGYDWKFDAAWHCAEWHVDATAHSYGFFHDGMEVPIGFTNKGNAPMSDYTSLVVGATYYQSSGIISSPFTIWFDDLAVGDARVGCE